MLFYFEISSIVLVTSIELFIHIFFQTKMKLDMAQPYRGFIACLFCAYVSLILGIFIIISRDLSMLYASAFFMCLGIVYLICLYIIYILCKKKILEEESPTLLPFLHSISSLGIVETVLGAPSFLVFFLYDFGLLSTLGKSTVFLFMWLFMVMIAIVFIGKPLSKFHDRLFKKINSPYQALL